MASGVVWPPVNYSLFSESSDLVYTEQTINANDVISGTVQVSKANYYPLGISGWSVIGSNSNVLSFTRLYLTNKTVGSATVNYMGYNTSNSTLNAQGLRVRILWIRAQ